MLKFGDDRKMLILKRYEHCFAVMNKYPYTNGHLMVAPYEHISDFPALASETGLEMFTAVQECISVLRKTLQPHGFNVGLNLGLVAGAGVEDHLHFHVVPRWNGDNNFMPVLADCRVISEHLDESYLHLLEQFGNN